MTEREQRLADDAMRARMAELTAEVAKPVTVLTLLAPTLAAGALMGATAAILWFFVG